MNYKAEILKILENVEKPGRYLGGEWNSITKDPRRVKVKVALAFPDLYEVGMSYLGQKILYYILNNQPSILAERVFAPWDDFETELRGRGVPLLSLENRIPLDRFDILGFSLLYELNYSNVLNMLDLGRIPLYAKDRDLDFPLVIAGGPAAFNPEPIAHYFDLFLIIRLPFSKKWQRLMECMSRRYIFPTGPKSLLSVQLNPRILRLHGSGKESFFLSIRLSSQTI